ncbi:hypothetical protein A6R70_17185 [Agrobacterium rubi]|nr:hypothetical protein [Agrobacterium rubi]
MPMVENPNKPDRALIRLLRFIGRNTARVTETGGSLDIHIDNAPQPLAITSSLLAKSISMGLLRREADRLSCENTVSAYLKRAMVKDRDEIFQEQHRVSEPVSLEVDGTRQTVRRNELSAPLLALARLKDRDGQAFFSAEALDAGERLASDFHRGHLSPRITASWEPRLAKRTKGHANGAQDLSDTAMSARLRFSRAADAMGPELSGVAIDVCCFEKGLELVERERQWPVRSAKLMLRTALLVLSRHYAPPQGPSRRRDGHHWGAEDYRPV